jgi:hypothetical protein
MTTVVPGLRTVRFAADGAEYEIDLNKKTPQRSAGSWHGSSNMPAGRGGDRVARPGVRRRAGRAVPRSGARVNEQDIPVSGRGHIPASVVQQLTPLRAAADAVRIAVSTKSASGSVYRNQA